MKHHVPGMRDDRTLMQMEIALAFMQAWREATADAEGPYAATPCGSE